MKSMIEDKLKKHLNVILYKEDLSSDDINFMIYMLNRAELKEAQEANKAELEKSNEEWKNRMKNLIEGVI